MKGSRNAYLVAGILFLALLAVALVFVLILKPADSEYNNTIPAVMGVLTLLGIGVSTLANMLNVENKHRENIAHIEKLESEKGSEKDGG